VKRTLLWLQGHSAEEIRRAIPAEYLSGEAAVDVEVLRVVKTLYSPDGAMPSEAPEILRKALSLTQPNLRAANIDLPRLYTNEFVAEQP
jgi:NitT/TauT family transport system substrate-binding protein